MGSNPTASANIKEHYMKLWTKETIHAGQIVPDDAYIAYGRLKPDTNVDGGWYVLFNFPFIKKVVDNYVNPWTFEVEPTQCYARVMFKCCKFKNCDRISRWWSKVWTDI